MSYIFQEQCINKPAFEQPGSNIKTVIITEDVVKDTSPPVYITKDTDMYEETSFWIYRAIMGGNTWKLRFST